MSAGQVEVTVTLLPEVAARLAVLDEQGGPGAAAAVLATLADHAQQGVCRPGSWERGWLCQVFGDGWLDRTGPDTRQG
jgi:hypothetical protein